MAKPWVLITGGAGGIGRATADAFHQEGWKVATADRTDPPAGHCADLVWKGDLASEREVAELASMISQSCHPLKAIVNNAGVFRGKGFEDTGREDWEHVIQANLTSVYLVTKHLLACLDNDGSIVNVSSVHALATSPGASAYAASKGGLLSLTRSLALELAPKGIRVNSVLPGATDTNMLQEGLSREGLEGEHLEARMQHLRNRHPLGRIGKPEEIAQAIFFLSDPSRASFITGQSLVVDGGALARLSTE